MSNFYVVSDDVDSIKAFFSVIAEEDRPKIVSDKEYPAAWDHPSDKPTVIVTQEPRLDADAVEISVEGKQADEVMREINPDENVQSEDINVEVPEAPEEDAPVKGPLTYADRGFKVGRLV